jgi:hypothetical protein
MDSVKMYLDDENVYAPLVMVSLWVRKGHLPTRQFIKMDRLIPVSIYLCFLWTILLQPNSQEKAKIFTKASLQYILHLQYIPVNPYPFLKKHHNLCTLPYILTASDRNKQKVRAIFRLSYHPLN